MNVSQDGAPRFVTPALKVNWVDSNWTRLDWAGLNLVWAWLGCTGLDCTAVDLTWLGWSGRDLEKLNWTELCLISIPGSSSSSEDGADLHLPMVSSQIFQNYLANVQAKQKTCQKCIFLYYLYIYVGIKSALKISSKFIHLCLANDFLQNLAKVPNFSQNLAKVPNLF